jgi:hypothetical protein
MTDIVLKTAAGLAKRTSRSDLLARGGKLALGVVGGSALVAIMAETALANCANCDNPPGCLAQVDCSCAPYYRFYYVCPNCSLRTCAYSTCTNLGC